MESNSAPLECDCLAHRFGNAADRPYRRPGYPSDMSDAEWGVVRDTMPVPPWLAGRGGRPEGFCHREMLDAVRYLVAGGIAWRASLRTSPPGTASTRSSAAGVTPVCSPSSTTGCATGSARRPAGTRSRAPVSSTRSR
ncbi:transposase [Streptomyces sp. NPDC096046]|uniref:transposase n=1 Tax=Streptomyces sp. NPDC096046 TaxID=3155542 RepID=UPI00331BCD65